MTSLNGPDFPCHVRDAQWRAQLAELLARVEAEESRSRALTIGTGAIAGGAVGVVIGQVQEMPFAAALAAPLALAIGFAVGAAQMIRINRDEATAIRAAVLFDQHITGGPHDGPAVQRALGSMGERLLNDAALRGRLGRRTGRALRRRREDH
jgi:hypothetical protein